MTKYEISVRLSDGNIFNHTQDMDDDEFAHIANILRDFPKMAYFKLPVSPVSAQFFNPAHIVSVTITEIEDENPDEDGVDTGS